MGLFAGWLWRNGVRKGIVGGSRGWIVVAVVSGAVRFVKRMNARGDRERLGLTLLPGETIELSVVEPGRRGRKPPGK